MSALLIGQIPWSRVPRPLRGDPRQRLRDREVVVRAAARRGAFLHPACDRGGLGTRGASLAVHPEDAEGAGRAIHTVFVNDLDAVVAEIASRGIEPDERVTYPGKARKAIYRDTDGNEIGFGGAIG
jgi:hypothetical protein